MLSTSSYQNFLENMWLWFYYNFIHDGIPFENLVIYLSVNERNVKLAGYLILDIGHSNVQCLISNIQLASRSCERRAILWKCIRMLSGMVSYLTGLDAPIRHYMNDVLMTHISDIRKRWVNICIKQLPLYRRNFEMHILKLKILNCDKIPIGVLSTRTIS